MKPAHRQERHHDRDEAAVIEVLHVADCPNCPEALALVEPVRVGLGIDAELHTTLVADQAAAERAAFQVPHYLCRRA